MASGSPSTVTVTVTADVAAKLRPGDYGGDISPAILATEGIAVEKFVITKVTPTVLTMAPVDYEGKPLTVASIPANTSFNLYHVFSKQEQAENIAAVAGSMKNKNMRVLGPHVGYVTDGDTKKKIPSWANAIIFAATRSALPPHQGMTNYPIPVIADLEFANEYFEFDQMQLMAENGICLLMQDAENAPVYCRHQLTTDVSTFDTSEISVVETVDEISMEVHALIKPLIGIYNITDELLELIGRRLREYILTQKLRKYPRCGSKILSGDVLEIRAQLHGQNLDVPKGRVLVKMKVEVGRPFNYGTITILV